MIMSIISDIILLIFFKSVKKNKVTLNSWSNCSIKWVRQDAPFLPLAPAFVRSRIDLIGQQKKK
jgi:hypothetical protein